MSPPSADRWPSSAVIVKPGSMGDVVHALPVAAALKSARPACRLGWVIDERWAGLLDGNPDIDDVIIFPREKFRGASALGAVRWAAGLCRYCPDVVLDLQGLLRSALISRSLCARRVVGLGDAREGARWFYDEVVSVDADAMHSVERYLAVLVPLRVGLPQKPVFWLPQGILPSGLMVGDAVVLHPFARGEGKSLDRQALDALIDGLKGCHVILVGPHRDIPTPPHVTNLLGKTTLPELLGILRAAAFVVSVDSGPAHLADAMGTRLLSIHTWSNPASVGPYSPDSFVWQAGRIVPAREARGARPAGPGRVDAEAIAHFVCDQVLWQAGGQ